MAAWWITHPESGFSREVVIRGAWAAYVGTVFLAAGTASTVWPRIVLGGMWSSAPGVKERHKLHTTGPYAVTRHPLYTGMVAMAVGSVLADGPLRALIPAALFLAYVLVNIRGEDRPMTETFGDRYPEYRRRTPRLIPRLPGYRCRRRGRVESATRPRPGSRTMARPPPADTLV